MSLTFLLLIILAAFAATAMLSKRIEASFISLPMIFTGLGLALSGPISGQADHEVLNETTRLLAEITLILVLFSDASHVRFDRFRHIWRLPARMLIIGMPLTILAGTLVAYLIAPGAGLAMSLLTAAVLTPTDAALAQTVVENEDVPAPLRQTLNVESGLNDGLALPFVMLGALLVTATMEGPDTSALALQSVWQVLLGPIAGIAVGWVMAKATSQAEAKGWANNTAGGIVVISTAFGAYLLAEALGGNGFIAAFVAGMTFGNCYTDSMGFVRDFMADVGQLLTMSAFVVFGAVLLPAAFDHATWPVFLLAALFLTVVRMGPIWLSLAGTGLTLRDKLFLGWFGPRGLASILFTLIILDEFELPGEAELLACVSMTVGLSILLHGLSATPIAQRMGGR